MVALSLSPVRDSGTARAALASVAAVAASAACAAGTGAEGATGNTTGGAGAWTGATATLLAAARVGGGATARPAA